MRAAWVLALLPSLAVAQSDGGGRDVSVAMFSTHAVHAVTITSAGEGAWTSGCAACAHKPLTAPVTFVKGELFAGGPVQVRNDANPKDTRTATGLWHLRATGGDVDVVLTIPSERYVTAVVAGEASPGEKLQALEALAIVARTYALNGKHWTPRAGHLPATLCDSTQCQAMKLGRVPSVMETAVRNTAGETMWFHARRAEVFFSQHCGGSTEAAGAVWPTLRRATYLNTHPDIYCLRKDKAAWHAEVPLAELQQIARDEGWTAPAQVASVVITQRSPSQRALKLAMVGADGTRFPVAASSLRLAIGRALGWNQVRSDLYDVAVRHDAVVFEGKGHGHGVGLCQVGAGVMAADGKTAREIVSFYFTGVTIGITPSDTGWQQSMAGPLHVRSLTQDTTHDAMLLRAWNEAAARFPSQHALAPEVTVAPSVEVFRQLTASPGWLLATTRGQSIVLQPWTVLQTQAERVLLHEFLHLQVEAEAGNKAPLWLREGLAEALAGDKTGNATLPAGAIDAALRNTDDLRSNQQAHEAAAAKVRALIQRYGLSSVRGWLASGVPAGIV